MSVQYIDLRLTRTATGFALDLHEGELFNEGLALALIVESHELDARLNAFPAGAFTPRLRLVPTSDNDDKA